MYLSCCSEFEKNVPAFIYYFLKRNPALEVKCSTSAYSYFFKPVLFIFPHCLLFVCLTSFFAYYKTTAIFKVFQKVDFLKHFRYNDFINVFSEKYVYSYIYGLFHVVYNLEQLSLFFSASFSSIHLR